MNLPKEECLDLQRGHGQRSTLLLVLVLVLVLVLRVEVLALTSVASDESPGASVVDGKDVPAGTTGAVDSAEVVRGDAVATNCGHVTTKGSAGAVERGRPAKDEVVSSEDAVEALGIDADGVVAAQVEARLGEGCGGVGAGLGEGVVKVQEVALDVGVVVPDESVVASGAAHLKNAVGLDDTTVGANDLTGEDAVSATDLFEVKGDERGLSEGGLDIPAFGAGQLGHTVMVATTVTTTANPAVQVPPLARGGGVGHCGCSHRGREHSECGKFGNSLDHRTGL